MRIIAGNWRGRPLTAPPGDGVRPTADRARETLFSMLTSRLGSFEGLGVLDAFAGSGALGLEALSRGAAAAAFLETDRAAVDAIRANIAALSASSATVLQRSALAPGHSAQGYDVLLLDPPYGQQLGPPALAALLDGGWIAPHAWISVETGLREPLDAPGFTLDAERKVGKALLRLLRPL